ncbi:MAG: hypothetical protein CW335_00010 [Clostridiales bacterium]|nr:hypothetical protein [Clostridiales bacterium]
MEKIDPKRAQEVWQRVLQSRQEHPDEEQMRQWIAEIMAVERGYRRMNAGRQTPLLRQMASEEQQHRRQLAALYFLLYGKRPDVLSGAAPGGRSLASALRDAYTAEQRAVRQWRSAAQRWITHRELFEDLAQGDQRHLEFLRRIMAVNL